MVSTASIDLPHIPGSSIFEQLYTGSKTAVYRALRDNQQDPVVIKVLQREYPNFSELVQFRSIPLLRIWQLLELFTAAEPTNLIRSEGSITVQDQ